MLRDPLPGSKRNLALRWVDWVLRGTGQVVFQSNWASGLLILVAIGVNSPAYLVSALVGVVAATGAALLLRMDRGLIEAGLTGFNGVLLGIGLNAYLSEDFTAGHWPDFLLYAYIVVGAAMTTVVLAAVQSWLGPRGIPALTAPFVFTTWLFLFAAPRFGGLHPGPLLRPALPAPVGVGDPVTALTWFEGTFKGVAEIFFQDNVLSGVLILVAIGLNSRIGALLAFVGSLSGVGVAVWFCADAATIALGLYGFNAALTALALGGVFFAPNRAGLLYALFGTLVTVFGWAALNVALAPAGMPTLTSAFVFVTWAFLAASSAFPSLGRIDPADST